MIRVGYAVPASPTFWCVAFCSKNYTADDSPIVPSHSHLPHKQLCFADYVVCNALLSPWLGDSLQYHLVKWSFLIISFLAMISHCRTMLTDPGAVPHEYQPNTLLANEQGNSLAMCSRCNGFKPPRAHHCSQCDRCIMKMDHHCPWVNNWQAAARSSTQQHAAARSSTQQHAAHAVAEQAARSSASRSTAFSPTHEPTLLPTLPPSPALACPRPLSPASVGANNQKHFVLFTFYTALLSGYAMVLLVLRAVYTVGDTEMHGAIAQRRHATQHGAHGHVHSADPAAGRFLMMILLFLEALLFGLFTMAVRASSLNSDP